MEPIQTGLQAFKDRMSTMLFGMTLSDAHSKNLCISCKSAIEPNDWDTIEADEYLISGLCPICFAKITKDEEN